ncbi:uncharacterized protein LOC143235426 isoform X2 [Tachypleus tridentatus]|uniref:uncharacterized protein LOC143235426 isoform X2 n=1 Tax=Tachypleus tridentatus TaxID=6853 RepID=UPI003FD340C8
MCSTFCLFPSIHRMVTRRRNNRLHDVGSWDFTNCKRIFQWKIGLLGWVGSYRRGGCLLNLFLFLTVVLLASEVGGIIALNIMQTKMTDILSQAWSEVNQETRNILQEKFKCCGFLGPKEFIEDVETSHNNCYLKESSFSANVLKFETDLSKFQVGCKEYLVEWFYQNKIIWIAALGVVLLLQVDCGIIVVVSGCLSKDPKFAFHIGKIIDNPVNLSKVGQLSLPHFYSILKLGISKSDPRGL